MTELHVAVVMAGDMTDGCNELWARALATRLGGAPSVHADVTWWSLTGAPRSPGRAALLVQLYYQLDVALSRGREGPRVDVGLGAARSAPSAASVTAMPYSAPGAEALRVLHDKQLDIIFCLGASPPPDWLGSVARLGVTAVWDGEGVINSASPPFLDALAHADLSVEFSIVHYVPPVNGERPRAHTLLSSRTGMRSTAPRGNTETLITRMADVWVTVATHAGALEHRAPVSMPAAVQKPARRSGVGAVQVASLLSRRYRALRNARPGRKQWAMAYRRQSSEALGETLAHISEFELLVPPLGTQWADPFVAEDGGRTWLFFEEEHAAGSHGHIAVSELLSDGRLTPPTTVLDIGSHMSYPHVFFWQGEWWMIPETSAAECVSLFRATGFPFQWKKECDLIAKRRLVDCTAFQHGDAWWLFAGRVGTDRLPFEDLQVFRADDLLDVWTPHMSAIASSDVLGGRPAGALFVEHGALVRPAQNCTVRYGYGLAFQRIAKLSTSEYSESTIERVEPNWAPELLGVHTFNRSSTLAVVDVLRQVPPSRGAA